MQFDWWTFAFQLVNVAVLAWLLGRFLFQPVARIIAERKAEGARVLEEAEAAKHAAREAQDAAAAERDQVAAQRVDLLAKAQQDAEAHKTAMLEKAKAEAAEIVARARTEAERTTREEGERQLRRASELAIAVARRLLADLPSDARITGYPERLADAVKALGAEERAAILADGGDLHLVAPRELRAEERTTIEATIGPLVGHDGPLPVEVDERLVAGLELRSRHGAIHNSLGADLERVAAALTSDEQD